jgi:predicted nucleic acid-binding protein
LEITLFRAALRRHRRVALDACIFIYQWEGNSRYSPLSDCLFSCLDKTVIAAASSTVTIAELLVHPYETDAAKVNDLFLLLSTYPNLEWISPTLEIAALAAKIRAQHRLRTPDALQAATAVNTNATALVTNDPIFKRVPHFETLALDDYL